MPGIDLKLANTISCESCDSKVFTQVCVLKFVPKIMVGAPNDIIAPVVLYQCTNCKEIIKELIPASVGTYEELFEIEESNDE